MPKKKPVEQVDKLTDEQRVKLKFKKAHFKKTKDLFCIWSDDVLKGGRLLGFDKNLEFNAWKKAAHGVL